MRQRRAGDYPFFDNAGRPLAFAHRGGALTRGSLGVENSMAAFQAAVSAGFRYVETDVHATSDGVVLAFHDSTLSRVTGLTGLVADMSYDDLRTALVGGREPVPRLSEVLSSWPSLKVNVDCKSRQAIKPLARLIAEQGAWDRVCVASFSPRRLSRLREILGPRVATSYGPPGVAALRLLPASALRRLALTSRGLAAQVPVCLGAVPLVTSTFVERAHDLDKQVHVWTVDDPAEMARLLDLGVDGVMTDRTDILRDVLTARGEWR